MTGAVVNNMITVITMAERDLVEYYDLFDFKVIYSVV